MNDVPSEHEPILAGPAVYHRSGRAGSPAAAVPVRRDQQADVREAPRRRRRDRSGDGQSQRPAARPGHREAGRGGPRSEKPRLCAGPRHPQPAARGGRQVSQVLRRAARSAARGDRLPRIEGRVQPHVSGVGGARRHGHRAGPLLSGPSVRRGHGGRQCHPAWRFPTASGC